MSRLLQIKAFLGMLVAVAVLAVGFGAVFANPPSEPGGSSMDRAEREALERRFHEAPQWGFISRHGRTGLIQEVDAKSSTVTINSPHGALTASLNDDTVVREGKKDGGALTSDDLAVGGMITVNGELGADGTVAATEILVIDASEDGYNIRPYSGEGSVFVPVFP